MAKAIFRFDGKTVLITGALGGIGRATARLFFDAGAQVILSDLDECGLNTIANDLNPSGDRVAVLAADAADPNGNEELIQLSIARFGGIDFLVPNAGVYRECPINAMTDEDWKIIIQNNLDSTFFICRRALPTLRRGGAIVLIASMAGHRGSAGRSHYAATKGAILAFARSLAVELAPTIRVNAISPGVVDTPMLQNMADARRQEFIQAVPLGRFGRPEEIAAVIAFLCSDAAGYVTGATLHVNGGLYIA